MRGVTTYKVNAKTRINMVEVNDVNVATRTRGIHVIQAVTPSMTMAIRSFHRKSGVCINICSTASDLFTALSRADAKRLTLLPLEITDC